MITTGIFASWAVTVFIAAPAPAPVPPPPSVSQPTFAAQVSGRSALCDAFYRVMTLPRSGHSSEWRFVTMDDSGKVANDFAGTETLSWDRIANRTALVATSDGKKSVTRYVLDGKSLLCAALNGGRRTYYRVPLQSHLTFPGDALASVNVDQMFMSAMTRMALFARVEEGSLRSPCLVYTNADGEVIEQSVPQNDNGHRRIVFWRYRLAPKSHRPRSREEWWTWQDPGKPVVVRSYWRETLSEKPPPTSAATFSQSPAKGYTEVPPPSTTRTVPLPPSPSFADPKARVLLSRWIRSWSRFTSYQAQAHVREWETAPSTESVPPSGEGNREAVVDIKYFRPGKLSLYVRPTGAKNAFTRIQTLVSNGERFLIYEGAKRDQKRGEGANVDDLYLNDTLREQGWHDFSEVLPRILRNPREMIGDSDEARYRGALPLPGGGTAEAVTLTQRFGDHGPMRLAGNVGVANRQHTVTLYFDPRTGLPVRSEFELRYLLTGKPGEILRDLPNIQFRVSDFTGIRLNEELSPVLFDLSG